MSAQILDGREVSKRVRRRVKAEVKVFSEDTGVTPCLAVIIVGEELPAKNAVFFPGNMHCLRVQRRKS